MGLGKTIQSIALLLHLQEGVLGSSFRGRAETVPWPGAQAERWATSGRRPEILLGELAGDMLTAQALLLRGWMLPGCQAEFYRFAPSVAVHVLVGDQASLSASACLSEFARHRLS